MRKASFSGSACITIIFSIPFSACLFRYTNYKSNYKVNKVDNEKTPQIQGHVFFYLYGDISLHIHY